MTGGALNLSLLSRGVGEVHKNGHEKVEVFLEPEDYYNFSKNPNKFYLPPLSSNYPSFINASPTISTRSPRESKEFRVPKTFTTRKGALLLFSEDLAQRNMERAAAARRRAASQAQTSHSLTPASSVDPQIYLKTVEDLAQSILKYGSHDRPDDKVYLKFVHARRDNFERQIRPGYSAKRYLSTWTRNWDDTVFGNVIKKGYITERSLYHYNLVVPNLRRRLFYEDLSHMPQPYRLMRNMLMMPGSLSGYTFYRAPTQFLEEDDFDDHDSEVLGQRSDRLHNIRVIKTQGGVQEEVAYSDLDRQSQKDVITDLLVKSAVHYALKKQEEMYEESIIMAVHSQQQGGVEHPGVTQQEFDMRDAVESLLDSHHGRYAIGADLPEIDNKSHHSDLTGSFKGAPVPPHAVKQHAPYHRQSWPAEAGAESEKEYMGGVPVVAFKESGSTASESSSVPHLPPIRHALSPIRDVSRETTQHNLSLPPIGKVFRRTISTQYSDSDTISTDPPTVNVQPATPQHSSLTAAALSSHDVAGASTEAARGLYSRDTDALLEEDEAESASAEAETDPDRKLRKKGDMSNSSIQSSEKGKDRKASTSDVAGPQSSVDSAAHAPLSTTTSGTTKLRPQWKAGAQSLRKGLSPEEHETLGVLFCPPTQPHPPALFLSMQGHAPLSSSLPRSHDDDLSPHHSPFSSGPSSVHSGHKPGPSSHRPSHSSHPSSHQSTNNSPHPSSHQTNNSPHPSSHQTNNSAHPSLHQTNNSAHPSPHQSMNNSPRPSAHLAPLSSGPPSHASWAWDRDGYPKRPHKTSKPGSVVESAKGSMIMAPDGEIISVGGSVVRGGASHDVGDMSDVLAARHQLQAETAGTDESGQSDEEPDEWKATKKFSISQRSESNKKMHKREIDYTSGDIDATMSIHSWSYTAREPEQEFSGGAGPASVRSMPGLQLDAGVKGPGSTTDGGQPEAGGVSSPSSDGEHWARITERPEEEEIANIESREVTQEEIHMPKVPSPSPVSETHAETKVEDLEDELKEEEEEEDEMGGGVTEDDLAVEKDKDASTPRSKSIGLQTDSEVGSHREAVTRGKDSLSRTPRKSSEHDTDDEGEANGEEEGENEEGWIQSASAAANLEAVKEESMGQLSSRKPSILPDESKSRSVSKPGSAQKDESKSGTRAGSSSKSPGLKSGAPSVATDGKSSKAKEDQPAEVTAASAGDSHAEQAVKSAAGENISVSDGRKSTPTSKGVKSGMSDREKAAKSVSDKSKTKSRAVSGDKSLAPSATPGGRDSTESKSPSKGDKSLGRKTVSGRSSMKNKPTGSESKAGSRATTGGKLSQAKMKTPTTDGGQAASGGDEEVVDNPWDDEDVDDVDVFRDDDGNEDGERMVEDTEDYRMPSTPSEENARISGDMPSKKGSVDLAIAGQQLLTPPSTPGIKRKKSSGEELLRDSVSRKSSVTEKDIMDTLTEHAQRIAESVLSQPASGQNLEKDVQQAADLWAETHPPRPLSRAHSVREFRADAIAEIMRNRRASSAAPSAAEYRDLIKKSLATAAAKAAGIDPETLPDEAEISEELLEALANHKLSPDQIEVVSDSEGRTRIQSRVDLTEALGGVEEGHIFIAPGSKAEESGIGKRQISIPADRTSQMDDMEFDRISYQGTDVMSEKGEKGKSKSRGGSKAGSIAGGTLADLSEMEGVMAALEGKVENAPEPEDDFMKAVAEAAGTATKDTPPDTVRKTTSGKTTPSAVSVKATLPVEEKTPPAAAADDAASEKSRPSLPGGTATEKKAEDMQSVKSGKTGVSQKSEASKDSKKKGKKSPEEKDEPFVVGKVDQKGELEKLYGPVDLPPPPPPAKQEEKAKSPEKVEEEPAPPVVAEPVPDPEEGKGQEVEPETKPSAGGQGPPVITTTGAMDHVAELQKLYGGKVPTAGGAPPKLGSAKGKPKEKKAKKELTIPKKEEKKKKGKKGKKGKKKEEEEPAPPAPAPVEEAPPPPPPPPAAPEKELTPRPVSSEHKPSSPDERTEDESDYEIVREQSSPELDHGPKTRLNLPSPPPDEEEDKSDGENEDEEGEDMNLKSISNREARAAKRAAAAAKRREEVERRRREKEEQAKREKEEVERQVALQREMEEERRRREEERRMRKEQQREQEERERREQEETEKRKRLDADRERKAKEEYQRKLEEVKRKQHEEELRKHELMLQRQREEEERRLAEEEMLSQMAEQERLEYERKKKEEEEERKRKELEDKLRRAEEARKAMEEAQRLAEEMARKQAELEARLKFNRALQEEANGLSHSQEINRAFVYSYFDLLKWLGLDIPEFELAKLADY
ncbi:titin homolog [Aplysia californica]|uniref:Titin homolog n=1 Tax=Aplysia californica TaxID=6500 RepID=A0ABM1VNT3_APLCA|nr:titin homolog [Aplysia californica]